MKILHIIGGDFKGGAFKGARILHNTLTKLKIDSKIFNDNGDLNNKDDKIVVISKNLIIRIINYFYILIEKFLKNFFLPRKRSSFTLSLLGFDLTKFKEYRDADIVHIHWLNQGFINLKSLSKVNKPIVWTMRDMWPFTGGSHYTMDFKNYENSKISKKIKNYKKKNYGNNIKFVAISDWLKYEAQKSLVLENQFVSRIYNNIELNKFKNISKEEAKLKLKIFTKKKIILFGAVNPQNKRKGWEIFLETIKKLDKSKYYLLIFGNFWSQETLNRIGLEYKSLGYIEDNNTLNSIYSSSDIFVFPSIQEAFGKTWAEAIACNTPVVCFDKTPPSEFLEHKINSYIVKKIDSEELKRGIEWISSEIEKGNLKKNLKNKKFLEIDEINIAKEYINLYESLLNKE